jgi:predicted nucleic acid-binding protein
MKILLDTNILLRSSQPLNPLAAIASRAVLKAQLSGEQLCLVPQILYEFWSVGTRDATMNGLGLTPARIHQTIQQLRADFDVYHDDSRTLETWIDLVLNHQVIGKTAHDARLVAAMKVHQIDAILTFNDADFGRFRDITVLTPKQVLST